MKASALRRIWVIFSKEVQDNLRDTRSVLSSSFSAVLGPALLLGMIVLLGRTVLAGGRDAPLVLPVQGAENAPALVEFLTSSRVHITAAPADPLAAVRSGEVDLVLIIPPGHMENFSQGLPAEVQIVMDPTRQSATLSIQRTQTLLNNYSAQIVAMRLMARGVNPEVVIPLAIERVDVSTPRTQVLMFLNVMPYFVIVVVFVGGMYVIIDATAGERERGSLEPLLINPAARWEFVIGKMAASLPFAVATLILTLAAFGVAFNAFPIEDYIGVQLSIDVRALFGIFLISLPMVLMASGLQMVIATFTRSFKEAQTYVSLLPLVPALPGIALAFLPIRPTLGSMLIPTYGQQILINQFMRGEVVNPVHILASAAATLALAVLFILLAIRLYQQERILFGGK
jgi:sodium transport system permease protein